jgi:hypothetical protein
VNSTAQRWCAASGFACIIVFFLGFWVIAGFIPPPPPRTSGPDLARLFTEDRTRIRFGMGVSVFASALLASWTAAVTVQIRRMERGRTALAYTNLAVGALFVLEFIISLIIWESMTFRARDPQILLAMNDTAWLLFVAITSTPVLQAVVLGTAIFLDTKHNPANPVFPRWAAYLNYWVVLLFLPGTITVFFQDGPLAWNGLLVWYVPLTAFATWMVAISVLMLRSIGADEPESPPDTAALAAEVRELRSELKRLQADRKGVSA